MFAFGMSMLDLVSHFKHDREQYFVMVRREEIYGIRELYDYVRQFLTPEYPNLRTHPDHERLISFIAGCIDPVVERRLTPQGALEHPFIKPENSPTFLGVFCHGARRLWDMVCRSSEE
jgi:serine/threonine protein kinase